MTEKILASSASPLEIALVYPILKEYSPVTEAHNGSAGSHEEDKTVTYRTGPLVKVGRNRARQSQLTSRQITAAIKLNLQTLRGHRAKQNIKWQGGRNVYQPNKLIRGRGCGKHLSMFTRDFSNMFAHTYTDGGEPGLDVTYTEMQDGVLNHISFERT